MMTMRAAAFQGRGKIEIREVARPNPGVGEALIKVSLILDGNTTGVK